MKSDLLRQVQDLTLRADAEDIEAAAILTRHAARERFQAASVPAARLTQRRREARARSVLAQRKAAVYRREAARIAAQAAALLD